MWKSLRLGCRYWPWLCFCILLNVMLLMLGCRCWPWLCQDKPVVQPKCNNWRMVRLKQSWNIAYWNWTKGKCVCSKPPKSLFKMEAPWHIMLSAPSAPLHQICVQIVVSSYAWCISALFCLAVMLNCSQFLLRCFMVISWLQSGIIQVRHPLSWTGMASHMALNQPLQNSKSRQASRAHLSLCFQLWYVKQMMTMRRKASDTQLMEGVLHCLRNVFLLFFPSQCKSGDLLLQKTLA